MKSFRILAFILSLSFLLSPPGFAAHYAVDTDHTTVSFKVKHLLSHVQGRFNQFEGNFVYDPEKPETWKTAVTVQTSTIDTNVAARDKHLRSGDFFDVEKFPTMTFQSTEVTEATPTRAKLHGLLTIHGVEKPAVFDLQIHGVAKDPWGNVRAAFTATTTINRKDFGLTWNQVLEAGQLFVGEEVDILLEVEGILQKETAESLAKGQPS